MKIENEKLSKKHAQTLSDAATGQYMDVSLDKSYVNYLFVTKKK